jgi:TRIAD3 protein (E3 ubiquitin-protein ligase RNF216)
MPPTFECPICTDDFPKERMTSCEGKTTHYYCHDCAKEYAKNIIGSLKGVVACCSGDCKAELSKEQLLAILEPSLVSRLELNLQNEVLRMAGMDDLSDCPFCDFKAVLPPISEDPLFRCQNFEKCGRTSCRKCNKAAHPGLSCKAADKAKLSESEDANETLLKKLRADLATTLSNALICRCK